MAECLAGGCGGRRRVAEAEAPLAAAHAPTTADPFAPPDKTGSTHVNLYKKKQKPRCDSYNFYADIDLGDILTKKFCSSHFKIIVL